VKQTVGTKTTGTPVRAGSAMSRTCACGTHTGGGQCDHCRAQTHSRTALIPAGNAAGPLKKGRTAGSPMPAEMRRDMEQRFGADFASVRLHTDKTAAESADALDAKAYTIQNDIVFNTGQFAPAQSDGQWLLVHELAHVVQQSRGGAPITLDPEAGHERAADAAATQAISGAGRIAVGHSTGVGIARATRERPDPPRSRDVVTKPERVRRYPPRDITPEEIRRLVRELAESIPEASRRRKTIAVGLIEDREGHQPLVYTVNGDWTSPELEEAARRLGIERWTGSGRVPRGDVGALGDAEQQLIGIKDTNPEYRILVVAPSRPACADCRLAIESEGGIYLADPVQVSPAATPTAETSTTGAKNAVIAGAAANLPDPPAQAPVGPNAPVRKGLAPKTGPNVFDKEGRAAQEEFLRQQPPPKSMTSEEAAQEAAKLRAAIEAGLVQPVDPGAAGPPAERRTPERIRIGPSSQRQTYQQRSSTSSAAPSPPSRTEEPVSAPEPAPPRPAGAKSATTEESIRQSSAASPSKESVRSNPAERSAAAARQERQAALRSAGVNAAAFGAALLIEISEMAVQARLRREALERLAKREAEFEAFHKAHPDEGVLIVQRIEFGIADTGLGAGQIGQELVGVGVSFGGQSIEDATRDYYRQNYTPGPPPKGRFQEVQHVFFIWRNGVLSISNNTIIVSPNKD
jgi:Domain of unknown function (DUF4157)